MSVDAGGEGPYVDERLRPGVRSGFERAARSRAAFHRSSRAPGDVALGRIHMLIAPLREAGCVAAFLQFLFDALRRASAGRAPCSAARIAASTARYDTASSSCAAIPLFTLTSESTAFQPTCDVSQCRRPPADRQPAVRAAAIVWTHRRLKIRPVQSDRVAELSPRSVRATASTRGPRHRRRCQVCSAPPV